ncbi:MAG: hypothetical protein QW086_05615 [Pyrobaculum sp.]
MYDYLLYLLTHLVSLLPLAKEKPYAAFREGGLVVICIYGLSKDLEVEAVDVGGYYLAPESVERVGPAELREGKIRIPKRTQAALLIKGAEWADEVKLHTNQGTHKLEIQREGRCPLLSEAEKNL